MSDNNKTQVTETSTDTNKEEKDESSNEPKMFTQEELDDYCITFITSLLIKLVQLLINFKYFYLVKVRLIPISSHCEFVGI